MTGIICGTGSYVPPYIMDNDEIATMVETSDAWIRERTGVETRHIAREETTVFMAARASENALKDADMKASEIDLILVSTISSNLILPGSACAVQRLIGADNATCFDIGGAACSGFVIGYNTAMAYITSGIYKNVLVIGSESLSNLVNWQDRGTCILFGDGAGACVIKAVDHETEKRCHLSKERHEDREFSTITHTDGARADALTCRSRHVKISAGEMTAPEYFIQMNGKEVFKFAVRSVPEVIGEVLNKNGLSSEDIEWFVIHQANRRIIESVAKRMGISIEKFPMNIQKYGNTSSASIPILLDEMKKDGRLKSGQLIVVAGFGAGLTWGASVLQWR